jgi:hypothetical protein
MFKKVKSLLIAGLLVVGMGFAKVDSFAAEVDPLVSKITDIAFVSGEQQKVETLQQGYITVTMNRTADGKYDIIVKWDKTILDVVKVESIFEKNTLISDLNTCYDVKYEDNNVIVTIKDANIGPEALGSEHYGELKQVNVHFTLADSDGDGVPDFKEGTPVPPEKEEPETGDASIAIIAGSVVVAGVGLYLLNRKKDDEE